MGFLTGGIGYLVPFLVVLTVLVFVHELGHYLVARWNRVRIEVFSIGFGPEIFGWNDRAGTRWKFSVIPLGGYVKMFGDADPASMPSANMAAMSADERAVSFHHKRLPQRAAVVAAGPIANFLFAIVAVAALFATVGQPFTPPEINKVQAGSAAEAGGIQPGDVIEALDGSRVASFEDMRRIVSLNTGTPLTVLLKRGDSELTLSVTPKVSTVTDRLGHEHHAGLMGVEGGSAKYLPRNPAAALWYATSYTGDMVGMTLQAVWQMVIGARTAEDIGGPLRIAQM